MNDDHKAAVRREVGRLAPVLKDIMLAALLNGDTTVAKCLTALEVAQPPAAPADTSGLHHKYTILRADGSVVEGDTFVLKLTDPHGRAALRAYARSCRDDNPRLADELTVWLARIEEAAS